MDTNKFVNRHVGISAEDIPAMLETIGVKSLDELIDQTIPANIRLKEPLNLPEAMTEREFAEHIAELASKNEVFTSYIGMGWYDTVCPAPIQRNVFENPVWYTSYTPYQAEVSQGRLEALLNFQTVIAELTGLPLANCSLLDEATASLDVDNETEIQNAISRLVKGKTVLVIAHRMRTIEAADQIVVLADGVVAEKGSHETLMKKNGLYRKLVDLQTESTNWKLNTMVK